jgi:large subunit ribosomal protein L3
MSTVRFPRFGSLQFWPRKRAKKGYARVRTFPASDKARLLGFAGYKAGMTHVSYIDNRKNSQTKGEEITVPVTVVECPPVKIASVRFYKKGQARLLLKKEVLVSSDKELGKKIVLPKEKKAASIDEIDPADFDDVRVIVYTQPKLTSIGRKKPEVFEMGVGGSTIQDKVAYIKENLNKEIAVGSIVQAGHIFDIHAITKGKGFEGTTRKFGTSILPRKSEKNRRGVHTLGPWHPAKVLYTVNQPGKWGFHERTEYNKQVLLVSDDPTKVNPAGGFLSYGNVKSNFVLVKGSITGSRKRLVIFKAPIRPNKKISPDIPDITDINVDSKQGR